MDAAELVAILKADFHAKADEVDVVAHRWNDTWARIWKLRELGEVEEALSMCPALRELGAELTLATEALLESTRRFGSALAGA